jgi:NAD(P)-dependent dehydrogenase (short-subunit alcohol dehydrogenase family)
MDIRDHVALITGGASGLGGACARAIVSEGGKVMLADINQAKGEALAKELGVPARFARCDVTGSADMQAAVDATKSAFGALHFAICCAGIGSPKRVLGREGPMPLESFSQVIQINLIGTFNAIRLTAAAMAQNQPNAEGERGVIVTTSSVAAYEGQIGQAAYTASKAGIAGMTLPIAREFAQHGIRVMSIAPGIFDTPLLSSLSEEAKASLGKQVPFPPRLGRPDEFASLVRHILVSPMLNGTVIRLDGAIRMAPK